MAKSIEERKAFVNAVLNGGFGGMISPLRPGTLKNKVFDDGSCTGYTVELGPLSYRGVWLSTFEDIELTVDGEKVPKCDMMLYLQHNGDGLTMCFPIDDLVTHTEVFFALTDKCWLNVNKIGGLSKGEHKVDILIQKRADFGHSYGEAEQGYEEAKEFHVPRALNASQVYTI